MSVIEGTPAGASEGATIGLTEQVVAAVEHASTHFGTELGQVAHDMGSTVFKSLLHPARTLGSFVGRQFTTDISTVGDARRNFEAHRPTLN